MKLEHFTLTPPRLDMEIAPAGLVAQDTAFDKLPFRWSPEPLKKWKVRIIDFKRYQDLLPFNLPQLKERDDDFKILNISLSKVEERLENDNQIESLRTREAKQPSPVPFGRFKSTITEGPNDASTVTPIEPSNRKGISTAGCFTRVRQWYQKVSKD